MIIRKNAKFKAETPNQLHKIASNLRERAHELKRLDGNPEDTPVTTMVYNSIPIRFEKQGGPKDHDPKNNSIELQIQDTVETGTYRDVMTGRTVKPRSDIDVRETVDIQWDDNSTKATFDLTQEYWRLDTVQKPRNNGFTLDLSKPKTVKSDVTHNSVSKFFESEGRYGVLISESAQARPAGVPSWMPSWVPFVGGTSIHSQVAVIASADGGKPEIIRGRKGRKAWNEFTNS